VHILFVHKEYPGHYGHVASALAKLPGVECTFLYNNLPTRVQRVRGQRPTPTARPVHNTTTVQGGTTVANITEWDDGGVRLIPYASRGASQETHPSSLHFEISTWHSHAVLQALRDRADLRPDLVVGHGSYGTALHLGRLLGCPTINYCEFFIPPGLPHLTFRPEYPPREQDYLARHAFNAVNLLCLEEATACYCPTEWQKSLFPSVFQPKIRTIFDGVDRRFWYRREVLRKVGNLPPFPADTRIVTYCAYGLEPIRGFDIFMKVAKRICDERKDVVFIVVGADRPYYGSGRQDQATSFRDHVLAQANYDLSRFVFTGLILEDQLVEILSISDLHVYLTVPFVLSWSLMNALACACTVLGSDTPPVREMITPEVNGLLAGFDDVDDLTRQALQILNDPEQFRPLGVAGTRHIDENYCLEVTIPKTMDFFREVAGERNEPFANPMTPS